MKPITEESLFELTSLSQPVAAGELLFFVETSMDQETNKYVTKIYSIHRQTKEKKEWGEGTEIALSPNKQYLTFLATKDEKHQLMCMPIQGGAAVCLTTEAEGVSSYFWKQDGSAVFYQTSAKQEEKQKEEKKPHEKQITKLTYKSDGRGVVWDDQTPKQTYLFKKLTVQNKEVQTLLELEDNFSVRYVDKNEHSLIYTQSRAVHDELAYAKSATYTYNLATKETTRIMIDSKQETLSFVAINDTEDILLLEGHDFSYGFVTQTNLYVYDVHKQKVVADTTQLDSEIGDLLVADFQQNVRGVIPTFISSTEFVFSVTEHGKIQFYKGDTQGNFTKVFDERVHITDASWIGDDEWLVTYSTLVMPSALAVLNIKTAKLEQIYNPNTAFEASHTIAIPEMYWFKGYNDWDIQAWYVPPITQQYKHPAILYIHGGPQVAYGETFFHEMQTLAAKGYGVIMINPRGGNGYGQAFVASILGEYGRHDFDDLMIGVDVALEKYPTIDKEHLYVTGGSYGGFMTNWIVGHTNRFKAAVTQRSISNWISFYGVSDIGPFFVEHQLKCTLKDAEELWQMSPLAYVHHVETPLLVLHGESDYRCPLEQGEQLYVALKRKGIATKLITFPQSSHGLSRTGLPNLRLVRLKAISDWFESHQ